MESIMCNERFCYNCGSSRFLELHHCLHGSRRHLADEDGLTVYLCHTCHAKLHDTKDGLLLDRYLEMVAQRAWMRANEASADDFRNRYGKSYFER